MCISGFLQDERRCHGILKLSEKLHQAGFNRHASRVWYRPWNSDWADVAEHIWNIGEHYNAEVLVNVYAYSYGVGWGAVRFAAELKKRGLAVQHLVACDGVYRHPNPLLRWTSLLQRDADLAPAIKVPSNVAFVHPYHQTVNTPQGHRLVSEEACGQQILESIELQATHQYMDDADEFHTTCLRVARNVA